MVEDKSVSGRKLLLQDKNNYGPISEGYVFSNPDGVVKWEGTSSASLDEMLAAPAGGKKTDAAVQWLNDQLRGGPKDSSELFAACERSGISKSTLYLAKDTLKIVARKGGFQGKWTWQLPEAKGKEASPEASPWEDDPFASDSSLHDARSF